MSNRLNNLEAFNQSMTAHARDMGRKAREAREKAKAEEAERVSRLPKRNWPGPCPHGCKLDTRPQASLHRGNWWFHCCGLPFPASHHDIPDNDLTDGFGE